MVQLAVGVFDSLEQTANNVTFRMLTPPGLASWATEAMEASIHAVSFLESRLGVPYSAMNSKMDSISVAGIDMDAMVGCWFFQASFN